MTRVRALRAERGLSAPGLAARCAELGAPELTTNIIRNLESRARGVSVEQLLIFALALDVPPAYLLTPPGPATTTGDGNGDGARPAAAVAVTDTITVEDPDAMNRWVRGSGPLPQTDPDRYAAAAAENGSHDQAAPAALTGQLLTQFESQAEAFVSQVRSDVTRLLDEAAQQVATAESPEQAQAALAAAKQRITPTRPDLA